MYTQGGDREERNTEREGQRGRDGDATSILLGGMGMPPASSEVRWGMPLSFLYDNTYPSSSPEPLGG